MGLKYSPSTGGFYDSAVHKVIPDDATDVSSQEYEALFSAQTDGAQIVPDETGKPVAQVAREEDRLLAARAAGVLALTSWIERLLSRFTADIPAAELASWGVKATAARAHLAGDPQAMIISEASLTGETPDELAELIVQLADQYQAIVARATGFRRVSRAAIDAAETPEAVQDALSGAQAGLAAMAAELGM